MREPARERECGEWRGRIFCFRWERAAGVREPARERECGERRGRILVVGGAEKRRRPPHGDLLLYPTLNVAYVRVGYLPQAQTRIPIYNMVLKIAIQ